MGDRKAHSRRGQLLWATAAGLVVSVIGIGYSALYTPEMGRRAADAIDSAEAAGTAAAAASPASDISVSVSVPPDIAFTGGVESARTAETIATAIQDRRRDPVVSMSASPPTRSVVIASVSAVEESSAPIPVTVPPASALADAQGRDPEVDRVTVAPAGAPRAPGIRARAHRAVADAAGNAVGGGANAVSGAANAVGGAARGALGAVDHAAGGALGGGGGGLGKP